MFLKKTYKSKSHKLNKEVPFKTVYFLGIRESTTSPYMVYEYTTSGHMDLYSIYIGCPRRNGQNFGRVFLMLNYTDITQNTYVQS